MNKEQRSAQNLSKAKKVNLNKKKKADKALDEKLKETFPASDAITKY